MKPWPRTRKERESLEIVGFVESYSRLPHGLELKPLFQREKPDYIVVAASSGSQFGIELTAVYIDDQSVDEVHRKAAKSYPALIEYDCERISKYLDRLILSVATKIQKAKRGYDTTFPLILSVYINEYDAIYLERNDLEKMVKSNPGVFAAIAPYSEIVLWNLPSNIDVFSVKA